MLELASLENMKKNAASCCRIAADMPTKKGVSDWWRRVELSALAQIRKMGGVLASIHAAACVDSIGTGLKTEHVSALLSLEPLMHSLLYRKLFCKPHPYILLYCMHDILGTS